MGLGQARLGGPSARAAAGSPSPFHDADGFVAHPLLRPRALQTRGYQLDLARRALSDSTLVVMPAGLGTTAVAALVAAERLRSAGGFVLVVAPTRAPARRLFGALGGLLAGSAADRTRLVTAATQRADRDEAWRDGWLVVSTPETVEKEIESGALSLRRCSLLVIAEAHRALGAYAYGQLTRALRRERPGGLTMAFTSTPGTDRRRVAAIVDALALRQVEVRGRDDARVASFLRPPDVEVLSVELTPEIEAVRALLEGELEPRAADLARLGVLALVAVRLVTRFELAAAGDLLRARHGKDAATFSAGLQTHAQAVLLVHGLEILETQGCRPLAEFLDRIGAQADASRAERSISRNAAVRRAARLAAESATQVHPKVERLQSLLRDFLRDRPSAKSVVLVRSRDDALLVVGRLGQPPPAGQGVRCGVWDAARAAPATAFQVLVGTVADAEGPGFPPVDLAVFLDGSPSSLPAGKKGGHPLRAGRIVVLAVRDSRDPNALHADTPRGPNFALPLGDLAANAEARP